MYNVSLEVAELFGLVCPFLIGLKSLELSNVAWICDQHPDLIVAVAMLQSLNHLTLSFWAGDRAMVKLLKILRAPLRTLSVDWRSCISDSFWDTIKEATWPAFHPTIILENFAETLEELTCTWWWMTGTYIPPHTTYPRMRRLVINYTETTFVLAPFIHAFPNLTHMLVETSHEEWEGFYADFVERGHTSHVQNVSQQLLPPSNGGRMWHRMEEFSGYFYDLYIFGLACKIDRLILKDSSSGTAFFPFLSEVLSYTCPTYLDYAIFSDGLELLCTGLREADSVARSRLDTLIVRYTLEYWEADTSFSCEMETLTSAIQGIPLRDLRLALEETVPEGLDMAALAMKVINEMPTLQEVTFSTPGQSRHLQDVTTFGRDGLRSRSVATV
ncbi:hypothetical protein L226DRAFT_536642 [Lentinus tigrinus ALCF2SS1-7]|nr:hypothetical protein L226DRAFT_536642 [Lentinus tigrinus ALCF2SS1-7]